MGEAGAEKLIEYLFLVEFVITCLCEIPKKKRREREQKERYYSIGLLEGLQCSYCFSFFFAFFFWCSLLQSVY